jgi:hypothetical protein
MYLGSHKHSLQFVLEEQNHLGRLALFCNDLPSLEDINTIHLFFQMTVDKICKDSEIRSVVCVEVGLSKSSLHIMDFPYFGPKLKYNNNGFLVSITPLKVQSILLVCEWKDAICLYQGSLPHISQNSAASDTCTAYFDIYNSWNSFHLQSLSGCSIMIGWSKLTIRPTIKHVGTLICSHCWRFGHCGTTATCPVKAMLCAICSGPHTTDLHHQLWACCKAQPKATPPVLATPPGEVYPHPPQCVNCRKYYRSDLCTCSFWKNWYDSQWIFNHCKLMKVSKDILKFASSFSDSPSSPRLGKPSMHLTIL